VTSRPNRSRTPWQRVFGLDLVLLHAPSVWDFRNEVILQGPIKAPLLGNICSDAILERRNT